MLLAIDVGNTNLRLGTIRDGVLAATRRAATPVGAAPDEIEILLGELLGLDGLRLDEVGAFVASSTVPAATAAVEGGRAPDDRLRHGVGRHDAAPGPGRPAR
jgi:pantothenate kinase type III